MKTKDLAALGVVLLALPLPATAGASGGSDASPIRLDRNFGTEGRALVPLGSGAVTWGPKMAASMADGGLLLSNGYVLERLAPDGRLDPTFGALGTLTPARPPNGKFVVNGIAVDSKGRIVVAGTSTLPPEKTPPLYLGPQARPQAATVERYLPDGTPDDSFGENGVVETDFGLQPPRDQNGQPFLELPWAQATGVAVDARDRVVISGGASAALPIACGHDPFYLPYAGCVARFTETGSLDPSFGGGDGVVGGLARGENPLGAEVTADPVISPDGSVIFRPGHFSCPDRGGVGELDEAGDPVLAFGGHGRAGGEVTGVAPEADGSLIVMEPTRGGQPLRGRVRRLLPNGAPDPSFGEGGSTPLAVRGGRLTMLSGIAIDSAGRILVGGSIATEPKPGGHGRQRRRPWRSWLLLERLGANGKPDPTTGSGSRIAVQFKFRMVGLPTLVLDRQGRALLVGGYRGRKKGVEGLAVARFVITK